MPRALFFIAVLGLAVWGAVSLTDQPGRVLVEWGGVRVDTSVAFLLGVVAFIAVVAALVYRFWIFLRRTPGRWKWAWRAKRRQRGYQALTRGMVAVAAGDAEEARRQAKRANGLLDEPPLTMLVSAQAAQMKGDEKAAGTFFQAMMERPETEFLGLRGLLNQAIKRGDKKEALALARRAYRLQPKSEWVAANMFDLQTQTGQWLDARVTCDDLQRRKLIDKAETRRRKAILSYQLSLEAKRSGASEDALRHLTETNNMAPDFIPGVADLARLWVAGGKTGKAEKMIQEAWALEPHPALVEPFWEASEAVDGLDRVRATEKLTQGNPDHPESHLALARASLEARLWGEARRHLETALAAPSVDGQAPGVAQGPSARVCRMMAELEERENDDSERAREWLMRASHAHDDPAWVCDDCGNAIGEWSAVCGKCENFDSFSWRTPPRIAGLRDERAEAAGPVALPPESVEAG